MKTKTLILAALIGAAGVASSVAQSVYSANAVGYVTLTIPPGFSMIANPLNGSTTTIAGLIPTPPSGTQVYKFDTVNQTYYPTVTYIFGNWSALANTLTLVPGEGIFIKNSAATNFSVTFVGSVPTGTLNNVIPSGFSMISSQVPQAGLLVTDLGYPVGTGDTVYLYNNSTGFYSSRTFLFGGWSGGEPQVGVAESFFVKKNNSATWTRNFSVSN